MAGFFIYINCVVCSILVIALAVYFYLIVRDIKVRPSI